MHSSGAQNLNTIERFGTMRLYQRKFPDGSLGNYYIEFDNGKRRSLETKDKTKAGRTIRRVGLGPPSFCSCRCDNTICHSREGGNPVFSLGTPAFAGVTVRQVVQENFAHGVKAA